MALIIEERVAKLEKNMEVLLKHKTDELSTMGKILDLIVKYSNELQALKKIVKQKKRV